MSRCVALLVAAPASRQGKTTLTAALARLPRRHPVLPVPDARLAVLADAVRQARSVPVELDARGAGQPPE